MKILFGKKPVKLEEEEEQLVKIKNINTIL
jgi:hypothetical protein